MNSLLTEWSAYFLFFNFNKTSYEKNKKKWKLYLSRFIDADALTIKSLKLEMNLIQMYKSFLNTQKREMIICSLFSFVWLLIHVFNHGGHNTRWLCDDLGTPWLLFPLA